MKKLLIILFTFSIIGCSEEIQTVEWYKEHTTERQKILEECKRRAEPLMANSNCHNARKAEASIRRMNPKGGVY
ncbi:EexN family lipoprotein [Aggregatibacter actinomycetemcomitans]|uniref:EexN family lipoprotein n=1 Tax=Aggregatibacter actinomycetemcomitans TaxID=714 RepID=UPI00197C7A01|nr:EexN family lipoprotein [Aggregatibacter actinomycetemcomitans]MBN6059386.1 EexN family lipoprotein [Aggregatibacter actinomycetemcomitans]MBN6087887.1 EexN family lipoprotein [Aggregatibacter actinomycetemcomitans]